MEKEMTRKVYVVEGHWSRGNQAVSWRPIATFTRYMDALTKKRDLVAFNHPYAQYRVASYRPSDAIGSLVRAAEGIIEHGHVGNVQCVRTCDGSPDGCKFTQLAKAIAEVRNV